MSFLRALEIKSLRDQASVQRLVAASLFSPQLAWKMQQSARRKLERAERLYAELVKEASDEPNL